VHGRRSLETLSRAVRIRTLEMCCATSRLHASPDPPAEALRFPSGGTEKTKCLAGGHRRVRVETSDNSMLLRTQTILHVECRKGRLGMVKDLACRTTTCRPKMNGARVVLLRRNSIGIRVMQMAVGTEGPRTIFLLTQDDSGEMLLT